MDTVVWVIQGMTCGGCVNSVDVLRANDGVRRAQVSLETAKATIEYDAVRIGIAALKSIGDAGYEVAA